MVKRHKAKSGGTGKALSILENKKARSKQPQKTYNESDSESNNSDDYKDKYGNISFEKNINLSDDEDDEEEVFNLNDEDDNDEDDGDDIDEDEEVGGVFEDDDDDDDDDLDGDLGNLVKNLDPKLRNKILYNNQDDDEEELEEMKNRIANKKLDKWGKKKDYYSGDTADLEIGQEFEDAEEEEAAVKEIAKEKISRMKASDFFDIVGEEIAEDDDEDANIEAYIKKNSSKSAKKRDKLMGDLELIALGAGDQANLQVENINRDFTKLTAEQKSNLAKNESPELESILEDLKEKTLELRDKIDPLKDFVKQLQSLTEVDDDIVDYLQVKQQLLLSYCTNVVFYLYMKSLGLSVRCHPVMKQLLELRYCMEKMRPLDGKLKYQIDRLLALKDLDAEALNNATLRPNLLSMVEDDEEDHSSRKKGSKKDKKNYNQDDEEVDEEISDVDSDYEKSDENLSEEEEDSKPKKPTGIYKPPKIAAMHYHDEESKAEKQERKLELKRNKLRNSEILQSMKEEFGDDPENFSSTGVSLETSAEKDIQEEEDERRNFEEDRFIRLTMSRKDKLSLKRRRAEATRMDNLESIGDIGEFEKLNELVKKVGGNNPLSSNGSSIDLGNDDDDDFGVDDSNISSTAALKRTLNAFSQKALKSKGKARQSDDALYEEDPISTKKKLKKSVFEDDENEDFNGYEEIEKPVRRPIPKEDDDVNLLEAFASKKRKFLNQKQDHYRAEPRYGGAEERIQEGDKRAATYEMITNRGLTPHRSKINSNARVKKRVKYDKALIRRKGAVQSVRVGEAAAYGGELTGIKANVSRSRKF